MGHDATGVFAGSGEPGDCPLSLQGSNSSPLKHHGIVTKTHRRHILQPEWPADKVERRAVAALIPYARNARTHSPEQVDQIAASIREWGWTVPVLVDEQGGIIAGHGRVLAAHKLAIAQVPVMVAAGWSEAQKRAYVLADNKLALNAGWDDAMLRVEIDDLQGTGFDLGLIGFSADEIAGLTVDRSGLTDPDEAPDAPAIPVSKPGDVWLLGRHRLVLRRLHRSACGR
jgi:ParB-like chromosome segregation protein Spo0J